MVVYFLRHGPAGSRSEWQGPDGLRPLTDDGRKAVGRAAEALARAGVVVDVILTSPLVRARQTAEIAAAALGVVGDDLVDDERLAHGFGRTALAEILAEHRGQRALMVVGHEPEFSATIGEVTGGSVVMKKAGVARVDLDPAAVRGELVWLLAPRILATI